MKTPPELQKAVAEYQNGNSEAFNTLYEQSYKYLHTCVIHVVKNEDMAMDMLQETYLEISKSISQLKNTEDFLSWAAMIANRKCFAYLKKQKDVLLSSKDGEGRDSEDGTSNYFDNIADNEAFIPETILQDKEKQRLIKEIIDDLNDMQRLCVIGFYYNEQKQDEIAEELGIPVNTVKSHLNRAKAKIKEAVVDLDVKKGTRLYSVAPFMALLFKEEAQACIVRPMSKGLASAVEISAGGVAESVLSTGVESVKDIPGIIGKLGEKAKVLWGKFTTASLPTKAVVATTACAVAIGGTAVVMSPKESVKNEVRTADLDIVVTEDGISSELFEVDYTYSEEEQSYEFKYYMNSDKEDGTIYVRTFSERWIIPEEKERHSEGFKIGNKEFVRATFNEKEYYFTPYITPSGRQEYFVIQFENVTGKTKKLFLECMQEIDSPENADIFFQIQKDKLASDVCGFELDLEKLKNSYDGVIRYAYFMIDGWDAKEVINMISNHLDSENMTMDDYQELYIWDGYEIKEDFVTFNNLEWRCYMKETEFNDIIIQNTLLGGTNWEIRFMGLEEELDVQEMYEESIKNFQQK